MARQPGDTQDTVTLTITAGGTKSSGGLIDNCCELGLIVPALVSGTLTVQVSETDVDANYVGLVNQAGTAILVTGATTGGFAFSGNELGAALPYKYIRVVSGATQTVTDRLFTLKRKWVGNQAI